MKKSIYKTNIEGSSSFSMRLLSKRELAGMHVGTQLVIST